MATTNKYMNIFQELSSEIKNGVFEPNSLLPSEHELCERFNTSRETIRKALTLLSQNGFIQKMQGKGSLVLDISKMTFPVTGLVSFKEIQQSLGRDIQTTVHKLELIEAEDWLSNQLECPEHALTWEVVRARTIQGERVILDKDWLLQTTVPSLTEEICADSIYAYLEGQLGLNISYAKKEITVEPATDEDRALLDLDGYSHIVLVKNFVHLEDTSIFQYTESRHRLDKFKFVDFARRRK
ncbi:GntR family transcriptional regulator [Jeotgalibacillus alimentarius]|uniref:Trehalose operon repressor n=2 Tax=Jeotgalibacillus TaxID=157226 RepID=A0A0C2VRI5_9BACL|nr:MULTISPECIES: trehalose operon repressor [Jeotgalibacillus]KIL46608.1 GntR family transcriptional regulator [Jeotgalibacillus alimentarius]MBM7577776.1 GntR family trehalose operon transcriptional repressor [Jeotgalibacillus terrae]